VELRQRLGVSIYGVDQETVSEVVGRLLAERGLKLAIIDTLTGGQAAREITEAGFGHLIAADMPAANPQEALQIAGLVGQAGDGFTLAAALARAIAPTNGVGLALLGPLKDDVSGSFTFIGVSGQGVTEVSQRGRSRRFHASETDYVRRWLVIQGLDWVRRAVLGQLTSPVDWK
jgi:hypothetical protein